MSHEKYETLASMLAAAYQAYTMGTTYQTAERNGRRMGGPGPYWIQLAEKIDHDVVESMNAAAAERRAWREQKEPRS